MGAHHDRYEPAIAFDQTGESRVLQGATSLNEMAIRLAYEETRKIARIIFDFEFSATSNLAG